MHVIACCSSLCTKNICDIIFRGKIIYNQQVARVNFLITVENLYECMSRPEVMLIDSINCKVNRNVLNVTIAKELLRDLHLFMSANELMEINY